jgi:hypothetical protein
MRNLKNLLLASGLIAAVVMAGCSDDESNNPVNPATVAPVTNLLPSTVTSSSVTLTWEYADATKADSFRVSRGTTLLATVPVATKTYTDNGLTPSTTYNYKVVAVKGTTISSESSLSVMTTAPGSTEKRAILAGHTGTGDRTLSKDTIYTIIGFYFVQPGTKLIIPAGTRLEGDFATKGAIITVRGTATRASGQIVADGTAQEPIVFTSSKPEGQRSRGDWGGIVLSGLADLNISGKTGTGEGGTGAYGPGGSGNASPKNDDNSGILRYVRIEYGGTKITSDNEINGLTLNAVGTGTTIEYVQTHMIADDGFEWFGGTVNGKYLVSSGNDDDMFDMDFGYSGKLQFLFGIQDPDLANRGFEIDNDAEGSTNAPFTSAVISNLTLVGAGKEKANNEDNDGLYLRRNNKLKIHNAIVVNFRYGLVIDGANTKANAESGDLFVKNSVLSGSAGAYLYKQGTSADLDAVAGGWGLSTSPVSLTSIAFESPNPIPTGAITIVPQQPGDAFFTSTAFIGAFGTSNWLTGWTNFRKK